MAGFLRATCSASHSLTSHSSLPNPAASSQESSSESQPSQCARYHTVPSAAIFLPLNSATLRCLLLADVLRPVCSALARPLSRRTFTVFRPAFRDAIFLTSKGIFFSLLSVRDEDVKCALINAAAARALETTATPFLLAERLESMVQACSKKLGLQNYMESSELEDDEKLRPPPLLHTRQRLRPPIATHYYYTHCAPPLLHRHCAPPLLHTRREGHQQAT